MLHYWELQSWCCALGLERTVLLSAQAQQPRAQSQIPIYPQLSFVSSILDLPYTTYVIKPFSATVTAAERNCFSWCVVSSFSFRFKQIIKQ